MATNEDILEKLDDVLEKIEETKVIAESAKEIGINCNHCGGDGVKATSDGDIPCPDCDAKGYVPWGTSK